MAEVITPGMAPVNEFRMTVAIMADLETIVAERYRRLCEELIEEIAEETGKKHGAVSEVARRLKIAQSGVTKIRQGKRGTGIDVISRAIHALRLNPLYFFQRAEPRTYRDFVGGTPPFAAWQVFIAGAYGSSMAKDERAVLVSIDLSEYEPEPSFYDAVLLALRGHTRKVPVAGDEVAPDRWRDAVLRNFKRHGMPSEGVARDMFSVAHSELERQDDAVIALEVSDLRAMLEKREAKRSGSARSSAAGKPRGTR